MMFPVVSLKHIGLYADGALGGYSIFANSSTACKPLKTTSSSSIADLNITGASTFKAMFGTPPGHGTSSVLSC